MPTIINPSFIIMFMEMDLIKELKIIIVFSLLINIEFLLSLFVLDIIFKSLTFF